MAKVYLAFVEGGHAGLYKQIATPSKTPGKESPYIKSLGRRIQEEEFNEPTAAFLIAELKRCGIHVYDCAPGAEDVPLDKRTDYANKIYWQYCSKYGRENVVAIYISIHFNAFDGTFAGRNPSGFSVHIYPGNRNKEAGRLADCVINELKDGTKQINRGIEEDNFHVLRESVMPAILSENGFMDNPTEAALMLNKDYQKEVAIEHAKGVMRYFGLTYPEQKQEDDDMLEKAVVINSFNDYPAAEVLANALNAPVVTRVVAKKVQVAKELVVAGGTKDGLKADKFTVLSGHDRYDTAHKIDEYIKGLK